MQTLRELTEIERTRIDQIEALHSEILGAFRMTIDKAIEIGKLLTKQKKALKHGEWLPWVKANLPFSERTTRDYLRFYANRTELKSASIADLREAREYLAPSQTIEELREAARREGPKHDTRRFEDRKAAPVISSSKYEIADPDADAEQCALFAAVDLYFAELPKSLGLQAAHNLIKKLKGIVNAYQRESVA